ncbi:peptidoglycan recognition protein 4-like [Paramacrobiotus metropolitanus]|uniref:peptidoglycan recognition protein 4-like n=1 Tax=Paramacrobiotus metropolitanus TaxID=2943436 RepID=UPI0024461587|nr:peptidoglycan recognition protein 4-like [Paramacrobiotus metropolitanus]XP_055346053.1 peptidoglycan recognition protein 4-like [Paramacrobiotus metropolitanus]
MDCPGVNITTGSMWGTPELNASISYLLPPVPYMVFTHTQGEACTGWETCRDVVLAIREFHTDVTSWTAQTAANFVPEIFYNFLIGMDGSVFEGRGWDRRAQYHRDYDEHALVTAFIENIPVSGDGYRRLTYAAALAANSLLNCARSNGYFDLDYKLIVNIHHQTKDYILYPETMQSPNDTTVISTAFEEPSFSEGVAAGIAFGIILLTVLAVVLLALLCQHCEGEWIIRTDEGRHGAQSHLTRKMSSVTVL